MAIIKHEEKTINSLYSKEKRGRVIQCDTSTKHVTLEYFAIINKILNHYTGVSDNTIIEENESTFLNNPFSLRQINSSFISDSYKEKSFLEKVSFFLSTARDVVRTSTIDTKVESINKITYSTLNEIQQLKEDTRYELHKDKIDSLLTQTHKEVDIQRVELFRKYPEYKQAKEELDRLKDEKNKKIEQMNNLNFVLNEYRQYILNDFNPIVLKLLDLQEENELNFKQEYMEIVEKLHQTIDYSFKSTSSKIIIKSEKLLKWDELKNNIEILEKDNKALDDEIEKIVGNEFFINYNNENLEYFHTIKIKLNSLIKQIKSKITKLPKAQKDIELESLKKELNNLESKLQELVEQKTEYLNDIEEFNREYNLHLGELIKDILNLKKEILYKKTINRQKQKAKYQEDIQTFQESKETIDELKSTIADLEEALENIDEDDENYKELTQAYNELKEALEKLEDELELQEKELELAKEFIEDKTIEQKYEEVNNHYEEFKSEYEHIKEAFENSITLSVEEKKELKSLYKQAARLCHPDIVPDELKEKAHELMQKLNDVYSKKDISKVKEILHSLQNGTSFEVSSETIEDKELLRAKIKEYLKNIETIKSEIEEIKEDETYQTIAELDDWDEYFEELKGGLESEKERLQNEAREVLEEKGPTKATNAIKSQQPKKENKKTIIKEDSPYSKYIQSIENIRFEKIRKYCENLSKANEADEMQKYLGENGRMHKALIYSTLEVFLEKLNGETITLCDWGCSQGIASMLVLDYIKEKQLDIKVSDLILIDDDTKALNRAIAQVEALAQDTMKFTAIKSDDNNISDTIKSNKNNIVLNLFSNDKIPINFWTINHDVFDKSYFLCVSNENQELVDEVYETINIFMDVQDMSKRDGKIGKFEKFERIFAIDNNERLF